MEKTLNTANIQAAMEKAGLSQTRLAETLDVSKEIVSKWLGGKKFPRPRLLLELALALDLKFEDLVIKTPAADEPVIAFRKRAGTKTTPVHVEKAKEMGMLLEPLVPYLPFDQFLRPATLKDPRCDYDYIQTLVKQIRDDINISPNDVLDFQHLITRFKELQTVIIPVLWGEKSSHSNALHIYLPQTQTTWIYLNLDVHAHDFKFWMAHELGHVLAPDLREDTGEDFADKFAAAILFPKTVAENAYKELLTSRGQKEQIDVIKKYALKHTISLITVYRQINDYARHNNLKIIDLEKVVYASNTNFNKRFYKISESLFDNTMPTPKKYIRKCKEVFKTPFFDVLKKYIADAGKSVGYVHIILDTPLLDAKGIHAELS